MRCRFCNCFIYDNKQELELCYNCDEYLGSISDVPVKPLGQFNIEELEYESSTYEYLLDEY